MPQSAVHDQHIVAEYTPSPGNGTSESRWDLAQAANRVQGYFGLNQLRKSVLLCGMSILTSGKFNHYGVWAGVSANRTSKSKTLSRCIGPNTTGETIALRFVTDHTDGRAGWYPGCYILETRLPQAIREQPS
jgi:hypothetical protein